MSEPATTFTPRPGAAPFASMVRAQASMEARLLVRNGEQLLLALVIPLLALVGGVAAAHGFALDLGHSPVDVLAPGVLALAVMSTSFTSLAIATGFERRYGLIKRLGSSPLPRSGLLLGKVGALLLVELAQVVVIGVVALLMGWRPDLAGLPGVVAAVLAGSFAFASLGLLMAGTLRAEATLAAANLVYLLLLAGGAVLFPASSYGALGDLARWLPSGALGESLRQATLDGAFPVAGLLVLLGWGIVGTALTARTFRWE